MASIFFFFSPALMAGRSASVSLWKSVMTSSSSFASDAAARGLLSGRPAFVAVHVAIHFAEVLANPFFTGDRATFLCGHDLGTEIS